jgi:bifunctional non-homologous end joining protein LigD
VNTQNGSHVFVIHKHQAKTLHYDLRLEIGGAMPSWALPKGPSLDPDIKRLALPTQVHDLAYRQFEGAIPQGHMGAGPVMIWDEGTFNPEIEESRGVRMEIGDFDKGEEILTQALPLGDIKFRLYGTKLHGSFALFKTKNKSGKNLWLLVKHRDRFMQTDFDAASLDFSAKSKKSLSEIESENK